MSTSQGVNVSPTQTICAKAFFSRFRNCCFASSNTIQVLRYSALVFGIFYGFSHQRTITSNNHVAHVQSEYKKKESLIEKAKLEWAKKSLPASAKTPGGDSKSL
jgi:F-type H+-transporting ATP synthase subunit e